MENDPQIFPLDDALIAYLAEGQRELDAIKQRASVIEERMNGALTYFARTHGLEGPWKLAPNGRELVQDISNAETASKRSAAEG